MARILLTWELGLGYGHLAPYLDFVKALKKKGHTVVFAARDVTNAEAVFGREGVVILQAPIMLRKAANPYKVQGSFAQLMHNNGFADPQDLLGRVKAWLHLYSYVRPDLAIFDHSPTALVAARALRAKKVISGSGFLVPPPGYPLPYMRYWEKQDVAKLREAEDGVVQRINQVLAAMKVPQLKHMEELYRADAQFLLGFKELDHYPQRKDGTYLGIFPTADYGVAPQFPAGEGQKVFAYIHPFKTLPVLFRAINALKLRALIYSPELPHEALKKYASPHISFVTKPVDLKKAAAECDMAITNGTYGTTCALLLGGKPLLMIPQNLERVMVTRRVTGMGAGIGVQVNQPKFFGPRLRALLATPKFAEAAAAFAKRHAGMDPAWQTAQMIAHVERLIPAVSAAAVAPAASQAA